MRKYFVKFILGKRPVKQFFVYGYDWTQANQIATMRYMEYKKSNNPATEMWMDNIGQLAIKNW